MEGKRNDQPSLILPISFTLPLLSIFLCCFLSLSLVVGISRQKPPVSSLDFQFDLVIKVICPTVTKILYPYVVSRKKILGLHVSEIVLVLFNEQNLAFIEIRIK